MSYYRHHLFFCTNKRAEDAERPSCGHCDSARLRGYAKARLKQLGLAGPGGARANTASCLDRCEEGPCLVVYPESVWYTYIDEADLDEIIESHIVGGQPVERLRLPDRPVDAPSKSG
jgi:(2Fe-2S) ferredoxin